MTLSLARTIREGLSEPGRVLVFPSQLAADAWALESLRSQGSVDPERLIGWDSFKERVLTGHRREAPANRVTRTLWAAGVVARQSRQRFLEGILGPHSPSPSFVPFLARIPPSLGGIVRALEEGAGRRSIREDRSLADLVVLHRDYSEFMRDNGLFEPSWERVRQESMTGSYLVIAPELVEDFEEYQEELLASGRIALAPLDDSAPHPPLLRFEGLHEELSQVFLRIAGLLDRGVHPDGIGVTVSELDLARPWVEAAARRTGVPIVVRRGVPLSLSPFGRLLRELGDAASTGFGLPAMEALLLDRFATWREAANAGALVRFGFDYHAFGSYSRKGRNVDIWEESFRHCGAAPSLVSFYRRLRAAVLAIASAPDFAALKAGISSFRAQFLDEGDWSESERRMVERAMAELDSHARAEASIRSGIALPSPYALFMSSLSQEGYVPQAPGAFVQVFPWRVSALLPFAWHFLVGCGQDSVKVGYGAESFLREDQKEALGRATRDATLDFLRAYAHSGTRVIACHADEGISGWSAPHPFFPPSPPSLGEESPDEPLGLDPLRAELRAWRGEGRLPARLLACQLKAHARQAGLSRKPERDFGRLSDGVLEHVIERASRREDGLLTLSATLIDEYRACPFRWLVSRGLAVGERLYELDFFDARLAGEMAHRAIEALLAGIAATGPLQSGLADRYLAMAASAPEEILPHFIARKGPFLVPMFEAWMPLLKDRLARLVRAMLEEPGWEVGDIEKTLELHLPELGALLEGRIDRLARRGQARAIVDYKKKNLPKKEDLLVAAPETEAASEDDAGKAASAGPSAAGLADSQIAAYAVLAASAGMELVKASFWSIEKAKEVIVIGEGGLRPEGGYQAEIAAFTRAMTEVSAGIRAGAFGYAAPGSPSCQGCRFKGICRSHFTVR